MSFSSTIFSNLDVWVSQVTFCLGDKLLLTQRKSHKENLTFEEEEKRLNTYCKKEKVPEPSRLNVALCCGEIWSRWRCVKGGHLHIKEGLTSSQNNICWALVVGKLGHWLAILFTLLKWMDYPTPCRGFLHTPTPARQISAAVSPGSCFWGVFLVVFNWWLKATFLPITAELCSSLTPEI